MQSVMPEYSTPRSKVMEDEGERSEREDEDDCDWSDQLCAICSVCAGLCLRIAVSNLPQLTSLELTYVEMEDAEQQAFRFYHSWRHLRCERHFTTCLSLTKCNVSCMFIDLNEATLYPSQSSSA